ESAIIAGKSKHPRRPYITSSTDDGKTWSKPRDLSATCRDADWGWYATGPGAAIQLQRGKHKGRLVCPANHSNQKYKDHSYASHVIYSDDAGKSWSKSEAIRPGCNEAQVVELADGTLMMNMRSYKPRGARAIATSSDGGATWSKIMIQKDLPDSTCQASILRYTTTADGGKNRLLFANPPQARGRHGITVKLSYDEGKSWGVSRMIYKGSSAYSCLTVLPDKSIGLFYERDGYKKITLARFTLDWLTGGKDKLASAKSWTAPAKLVASKSKRSSSAIYSEDRVPKYVLPDPLVTVGGKKVTDAKAWPARRKEILELFQREMYGISPGRPAKMTFKVFESDDNALGGKARRRQVRVSFTGNPKKDAMDVLIYLPKNAKGPVPLFVGMNFRGNHSTTTDQAVRLNTASKHKRGAAASRWPAEAIIARGYGLATIYYGDIDPDKHDGFQNGVHGLLDKYNGRRPPNAWGSIAAWAWGLSRAMDYFETTDEIDHKRVAVMGHSRLGKTSLWAGAQDQRFAMVISNDSGCGGAALSKRCFGERVGRINRSFPHWFCENFKKYNEKEQALPLDQHMLLALVAPRPLYVASADEDLWADPRGEFLAAKHAGPVYQLLGKKPLPGNDIPPLDTSIQGDIGYHVRTGRHNVTDFDWSSYMDFADKHLNNPNGEKLSKSSKPTFKSIDNLSDMEGMASPF
ncbi:MAG: exo-alpha-sialidase, partial [Phycisphaerales bacterium]|nr:exo-alpha-sialidase [Phycisphaerales bacterium]